MKFGEKLRLLAEGRNRSDLSRAAGLAPTVLSNYINRGSVPRADIALQLARACKVPVEWLIDDAQGWPAPTPAGGATASMLSDAELMVELLKRRRLAQLDALEKIQRAEAIDWPSVRRRIAAIPLESPLPRDLQADALLVYSLIASSMRAQAQYEWTLYEGLHQSALASGGRQPHEFNADGITKRYLDVLDKIGLEGLSAELRRRGVRGTPEQIDMATWVSLTRMATGDVTAKDALAKLEADAKSPAKVDNKKLPVLKSRRSDSGRSRKA